mgnify:FL=1|tara:strand:- start:307 stop:516 length:210 start_codon:yes stop_codon:yes gene_type:complete
MSIQKGKVSLTNSSEVTVNFTSSFTKPVIKITPNEDINVFLSEVTSNYFKISCSSDVTVDIYYVVIEGN